LAQSPGGIPQALKTSPALRGLLPSFLGSFVLNIARHARAADVIHAHWSICGALAALTRSLHGKPLITTFRGSDTHRAEADTVYASVHRIALFGSDITVGVSGRIMEDLQVRYPTLRGRIHFVPNGVDDRFYEVDPASSPAIPPVRFLFAGSLIELKGLDVLLKAFGLIGARKDWTLTLAGEGAERGRITELAISLGIGDRVSLAGAIAPEAMPELMGRHHVLVLPSRREGRPNVVLEAMAAGLPVIATAIGGVRELVQDGLTGFLVPPEDEVLLAGAIERCITRPDLLLRLGKAGRRWMLDAGLTWHATAAMYGALYEVVTRSSSDSTAWKSSRGMAEGWKRSGRGGWRGRRTPGSFRSRTENGQGMVR